MHYVLLIIITLFITRGSAYLTVDTANQRECDPVIRRNVTFNIDQTDCKGKYIIDTDNRCVCSVRCQCPQQQISGDVLEITITDEQPVSEITDNDLKTCCRGGNACNYQSKLLRGVRSGLGNSVLYIDAIIAKKAAQNDITTTPTTTSKTTTATTDDNEDYPEEQVEDHDVEQQLAKITGDEHSEPMSTDDIDPYASLQVAQKDTDNESYLVPLPTKATKQSDDQKKQLSMRIQRRRELRLTKKGKRQNERHIDQTEVYLYATL